MVKDNYSYDNTPKPYAIYVHGIGSGAKSGTKTSFGRNFPQYEWLHPEFNENPDESLAILNEYIAVFSPQVIAGTSMGGFLTAYSDAPQAIKIVCNATIGIEHVLRKIGYGKHPFLCEREDGRTEYNIDEEMVRRFIAFKESHSIIPGRLNMGIYSMDDELAGAVESRRSAKILECAGFQIFWSDKFGHRMNDAVAKKIPQYLAQIEQLVNSK